MKKRTRQILAEVVPLLRELYPEHTDDQRTAILNLFSAAHEGRPVTDLDQSHIDVMTKTLRYWIAGGGSGNFRKGRDADSAEGPAWAGIEDVCGGCRDFKAAMLDINAGIEVRTDQEGHVLIPVVVADHDKWGQPVADGFKAWIVHGSPGVP